jgi:hypothetical protein
VEDPLSEALIQGQLEGASTIEVFLAVRRSISGRSKSKLRTTRLLIH